MGCARLPAGPLPLRPTRPGLAIEEPAKRASRRALASDLLSGLHQGATTSLEHSNIVYLSGDLQEHT